MAKSNAPGRFFSFFFVGRSDGLWRTAFWPWLVGGKEKPPTSADFRDDADSGGEIAPSSWVTNPRARTFAPWGIGAHITYIMSSLCQAARNVNQGVSTVRFGQAFGRPDRPAIGRS